MSSPRAARLSLRRCFLDVDGGYEAIADRHPPLPVHASIAFDIKQNTAFFRMRAKLRQPPADSSSPQGQHVYLDIPPEQLTSLSYCQLPDLPQEIQQRLHPQELPSIEGHQSSPCMRLTFHLAQPAVLVIPPSSHFGDPSVHIHSQEDRQVFEALWNISKQSGPALLLYSTELLSALTVDQLDGLCSAASTRALKSNPNFDPQRLFNGRGGTVVALNEHVQYYNMITGADDDVTDPAGPPSYEHAEPPPPLAPLSPEPRSAKRARESTPSTESSGTGAQSLDIIIQRAINSSEARVMEAMAATEARLQQEVGRQIGALRKELVACINEKLADYMTVPQMEAHLDEQLDLKTVDLITQAELEDHVNEQLGLQSADLVTRSDMEEFVEERLEVASQDLRDRIVDAFNQ